MISCPFKLFSPLPELGVAQKHDFIFLGVVNGFVPGGYTIALYHAHLTLGLDTGNFFDTHGIHG